MATVRLAVVGLGVMGQIHAKNVLGGKIARCELAAVADRDPARLPNFSQVRHFPGMDEMLESGVADAVLIATPHFSHTTLGIAALNAKKHVLIEKPISVHRADAERLLSAHRDRRQVFAAMFNQRTDPFYRAIRELVRSGGLGPVRRVQWTITTWYRTDLYYASGGWRGTWSGEGGGVLLNQCPHNLDLYQWIFGMPTRVVGFCGFGRYHKIETEDDVAAHFEHANGMHGSFITSTGESPGTNRLEVVGDNGRIVYENDRISHFRNDVSMREFGRTTNQMFGRPGGREVEIPVEGHGGQHVEVLQNFVDAILDGTAVIAPAEEGLCSVELANAILKSAWTNRPVSLPIDGAAYEKMLKQRMGASQKS